MPTKTTSVLPKTLRECLSNKIGADRNRMRTKETLETDIFIAEKLMRYKFVSNDDFIDDVYAGGQNMLPTETYYRRHVIKHENAEDSYFIIVGRPDKLGDIIYHDFGLWSPTTFIEDAIACLEFLGRAGCEYSIKNLFDHPSESFMVAIQWSDGNNRCAAVAYDESIQSTIVKAVLDFMAESCFHLIKVENEN
jgi:hypothetical protein